MKLKNNIEKIKDEFHKLKIKIGLISYFSVFLLFSFFSLIIALLIYGSCFLKDSIADYLPNDVIAYESFRNLKNEPKIKTFFSQQLKKYIGDTNDETIERLSSAIEIGVIFLKTQQDSNPIFIFNLDKKREKEIFIKEGIAGDWNNFLIIAKNPSQLKSLPQDEMFPYKKQLKAFLKKNKPSFALYADLEQDALMAYLDNFTQEMPNNNSSAPIPAKTNKIFDQIILENFKKRHSKIFAGIKKDKKYELYISDINNQKILSSEIGSNPASGHLAENAIKDKTLAVFIESRIFFPNSILKINPASGNIPQMSIIQSAQNLLAQSEYFLDNSLIARIGEIENILKSGEIESEFVLYKNEKSDSSARKRLHDYLMLTGENSPYQFVSIFRKNEKGDDLLEKIKDASILYLDQEAPREQDLALPDGTIVNEFLSSSERFKFKNTLNKDNFSVYNLGDKEINFEISYALSQNYILLSNSQNRLINFLETNTLQLNQQKTFTESFCLNLDNINIESELLNSLKYLGSSITGNLYSSPAH